MKTIVFDIETGPRPDTEISNLIPAFEAPKNYKDPDKIAAYISEERAAWLEKAALSAITGQILAIGFREGGQNNIISGDEKVMLQAFWQSAEDAARQGKRLVGFNIDRFDLPFLVRRSWFHCVPVPAGIITSRGYSNPEVFVDLMKEWQAGDRQEFISLDRLASFLGLGAKNGDGKEFAKLWATERSLAIAYLENDLTLTEKIMVRLLGISDNSGVNGGSPENPPPSGERSGAVPSGKTAAPAVTPTAAPQPPPTAPVPPPAPGGDDDY